MKVDSAVTRRSSVSQLILQGVTDNTVVELLLTEGVAIRDEAVLWDFKRELPVLPPGKLNQALTAEYDAKFAEIVKDAAAFYNTFGGYILVGIDELDTKHCRFWQDIRCGGLKQTDTRCHRSQYRDHIPDLTRSSNRQYPTAWPFAYPQAPPAYPTRAVQKDCTKICFGEGGLRTERCSSFASSTTTKRQSRLKS